MRIPACLICLALVAVAALAPSSHAKPVRTAEQLPNLTPLSASEVLVGRSDDDGTTPALRFDATIWNRGDYAFELLGRPGDVSADELEAEQCVAWATPRTCSQRRTVGKLIHHAAHGHWHFEDFALYELRRFRRNGAVDMTRGGLVAKSAKVSFCLQDVRRTDDADASPVPWPLYYGCAGGMGVMGISAGWLDIYGAFLAGQFIPIDRVPDGEYALVIHTDPGKRVFETSDTDNMSVTGVELYEGGAKARILCTGTPGTVGCDNPVED